ncbi:MULTISPECIES: hypothetical protein [unclassified Sphingobium]|uniref:hypothetical protein n=1 Tax=unclassified Sphingobium TaxID=2611147 RepID=UPI002223FCDD|nr:MULTISPECIES: hypothetical protein [unclassified Sphingobium]MCW2395306.1 hypothetical protein [Sphingobium sp. B8D3B]MCW2418821.1 hypothetical protein [Sphingobium sp. B8D3C]
MSSQKDFEGIELVVPNNVETPEYSSLMARVINALAAVEEREESEVVRSIREVAFDVVRSRIPDAQVVNDAIKLDIARSFVVGIRSVLATTATTELQPTAYFLRLKKEAAEYADRCRFGHTFRGSFGFTVESPLQQNDQIALFGIATSPPFERRVIQRLTRGLKLVAEAVAADSTAPITSSPSVGFSANVCEQLASLVEQTSQGGIAFDFSFSPEWSSQDLPSEPRESFFVGRPQVEVIKAAAKELRSQIQSWTETVYGRVTRLATAADPSDLTDLMGDREVAILWSSEELGDITVRCSLSPTDYLKAVEAHAAGKPVEVSGTLERRSRRWILLEPSGFTLHS